MTLSKDELKILASWYSTEYNTDETLDELINIIQKHGDN